jgi:alpha-D-ribose 1-methylphosphonate 5-phosphate C-P lyase
VQTWDESCALCGAEDAYLDEVVLDDEGAKMFVCSDSSHCAERRAAGHAGPMAGHELDQSERETA